MLVAATVTPYLDVEDFLQNMAESNGFKFMSESQLLMDFSKKSGITYTAVMKGLQTGDPALVAYVNGYATGVFSEDNFFTDYRYAFTLNALSFKVLIFCQPEQVQGDASRSVRVNEVITEVDRRERACYNACKCRCYNLACYDMFIDVSYTSILNYRSILNNAVKQWLDSSYHKQFWICTRSIRPTSIEHYVEDTEAVSVALYCGNFYCVGDNAGYYNKLIGRDDMVCVDNIFYGENVTPLSRGELYRVEDEYDIDYSGTGLFFCEFSLKSTKVLDTYINMNPKQGFTRNKYVSILLSKYQTQSTDKLASYIWKTWNSWEIAYADWREMK